jgi:hypothetical protein
MTTRVFGDGEVVRFGTLEEFAEMWYDTSANILRIQAPTSATSNTPIDIFDIAIAGTIYNEGGVDRDFRMEGANNTSLLVIDAGADSESHGASVVSGAAFTLSNLTGRTLVTAVGAQVHIPAGTLNDTGAAATKAVGAVVFVGARTLTGTNAITLTDVAGIRVVIPVASTNMTFTRTYGVWSSGQIRADSNFQVNNTNTFATTQPTASVVFQQGTEAVGAITTGGAISTDGTVMRKVIAAGTASNIET